MSLVAHQGGWDELLIVAVPLLLYVGFRLWEGRRGRPDEDAPSGEEGNGRDAG